MSVTYYAVLPFVKDEEGNLRAADAVECQTSAAALARAQAFSVTSAGAVAFLRTGNSETGDWADAVVLSRIGETPADPETVSGQYKTISCGPLHLSMPDHPKLRFRTFSMQSLLL